MTYIFINGGLWQPDQTLIAQEEAYLAIARHVEDAFGDRAKTIHIQDHYDREQRAWRGIEVRVKCLVGDRLCCVERVLPHALVDDPHGKVVRQHAFLLRESFDQFVANTPPPAVTEKTDVNA